MPIVRVSTMHQALRRARGTVPLREFAASVGVSASTLSRLERGSIPDLRTFQIVCAAMDWDPGEVLGFRQPRRRVAEVEYEESSISLVTPRTVKALARLIAAAHRAWLHQCVEYGEE